MLGFQEKDKEKETLPGSLPHAHDYELTRGQLTVGPRPGGVLKEAYYLANFLSYFLIVWPDNSKRYERFELAYPPFPVFSSPNSNIPAFLGKKDKESSFHPLPLFPGHQPTVEFW